jgi:hypothetical protein
MFRARFLWVFGVFVIISMTLLYLWIFGVCSMPSYHPSFWNDGYAPDSVQWNNNCYNYGNNKRTDTFAQPGLASGISLENTYPNSMNCTDVRNAAVADGVDVLPPSGVCPGKQDKLALVVDPGNDYHWYRLDSSGMWTHKPGKTEATNLDSSNNPITNPETADRGGYTEFCGYHCACSDSDEGKGHENIK